jgi:hypothetical protein
MVFAGLRAANKQFDQQGIPVRAAGYSLQYGEMAVALVVNGDGPLRESLDALPGPDEVKSVVEPHVAFMGMELVGVWHNDETWSNPGARSKFWLV